MKTYQVVIIVVIFFLLGYFFSANAFGQSKLTNATNTNTGNEPIVAGQVDLWCANGKYYKRTTTTVYGQPTLEEITKQQFEALVSQGISYSGCSVDSQGNITP